MPLLILDLDETLIHSVVSPLTREPDFLAGPYHVYKRPGVDGFIRHVDSLFELAIWTAASTVYATSIIEQLFPADISLSFFWTRDRCTPRFNPATYSQVWIKDLEKVRKRGYDLKDVLVVDDTAAGLARQYANLVHVTSFHGDPSDNELQLLQVYLPELAEADDVRLLEKRNWRAKVVPSE